MYPLFHEAVSLPIVRDWLGWNAAEVKFKDNENLETFYQLITPRNPGQDDEKGPKIRTYSEVRQLRDILPNNEAKSELLQIDREFVDALSIANQGTMSRRWRNEVAEAKTALSNIPAKEVRDMGSEDLEGLKALIAIANDVIEMNGDLNR